MSRQKNSILINEYSLNREPVPLKQKAEKVTILNKNYALTPLEKCKFWGFLILIFYSLKRLFFILDFTKHFFSINFALTQKKKNSDFFFTQTMD